MANSNVSLITTKGPSKDKKDERGLPWLVGYPAPTAEVVKEIVEHFHTYALRGKLGSENKEEFDRLGGTFRECVPLVRGYFKDKARQIDTKEARDIAEKALELVDEFDSWFYPRGQAAEQDWESYMKLFVKWKRVMRRFNMCMNSGNQEGKPAETEQDIPPAREEKADVNIHIAGGIQAENVQIGNHASIHKQPKAEETPKFSILGWIRKKIYHLVGAIIVGLIVAILIDIFGDFGWLEQIKTFFYKILRLT